MARSTEEAKIQAKTGHAVMSIEEEELAQAKIKAEEVFEKAEDVEAVKEDTLTETDSISNSEATKNEVVENPSSSEEKQTD